LLFARPFPSAVEVREILEVTMTAIPTTKSNAVPEALVRRAQGEFLEMPGLRLTQLQACRLWGLDRETCGQLLSRLVDARFLSPTRDGAFVQAADLFVRL
jgi:hypothetical protein